jgi:hypothetical protein
MLAVTFIVSCVSVCGFYGYVFVHLRREQRRLDGHKKRLREHLYEMEPEAGRDDSSEGREDPEFLSSKAATLSKANDQNSRRREALVQVSLALGGLAGLFGGIELFKSLVTRLHWN